MRSPKCVRVDDRDEASAASLKRDGWRFIERLVIMERETQPFPPSAHVKLANRETLRSAIMIGREHMGPNRFIRDGVFSKRHAANVREKWLRENAERLYVFESCGLVEGFLLEGAARLELIVVDPKYRQNGIGAALTEAFIDRAWRRGIKTVTLGTQDDNVRAFGLYHKLGFRVTGALRTFHK